VVDLPAAGVTGVGSCAGMSSRSSENGPTPLAVVTRR
jgi:hypothetical protein